MKNSQRHARLASVGLVLLAGAFSVVGTPASAQTPAASRPQESQVWLDRQKAQAWATQKIDRSPRRHEWVTITNGGRTLRGFITYPTTRTKTAVVLVPHEVFGLTDSTRNTADQIAALGYITIAPDMLSGFGPDGGGTSSFPASQPAGTMSTAIPDPVVNSDFNAWADYALKLPQANGKLAIAGLSWGGGAAFRYANSPSHNKALKLVCVFFDVGPPAVTQGPFREGKNNPPMSVASIDVPVYGFYGSTDTRVMASLPATKDAMAGAGKFYDPVVYEGADHAYMRLGEDPADKNPANAAAVKASLERLAKLLKAM